MALKFRTRAERTHRSAYLTGREHEIREAAGSIPQPAAPAMSSVERAAMLAGRAIFGGYFIYNGINHFVNREMMTGYVKSKGVRWPKLAVLGTGAMLVAGGLSLLTGVKPKVGASLVTTFLTGVTPMMHDYWNATDPMHRMNEMVNFTKNIGLIGGAAFAAAVATRPCPRQ